MSKMSNLLIFVSDMRKTYKVHKELHIALLNKYIELLTIGKNTSNYSTGFYKRIGRALGKFVFTDLKEIDKNLFYHFQYKTIDRSDNEFIEIEGLGYKTISRALPKDKNGYASKQVIELIGYFVYQKIQWENLRPKLGAHQKKPSNNIIEKKTDSKQRINNLDFKTRVSSFLNKQHQNEYLIEQDKLLKGNSGIRRLVDFYLLSLSTKVKIEWIIDCFYSESKATLTTIEGMLAKQKDCRTHKSGIITNLGFDESATKYGLTNKMYLVVIPNDENVGYISRLRQKNKKSISLAFVLSLQENKKYNPIIPFVLKKKIIQQYFNLDIESIEEETKFELVHLT